MSRYSVPRKHKPIEPRLGSFECRECGEPFTGYYSYNRLVICSDMCRATRTLRQRKAIGLTYRKRNRRTPEPRDCALCGLTFQPRTRVNAKYCTPKCYMRVRNIFTNYDLSLEDYKLMLERQEGKCAACLHPFGDATPFVDHDHQTGAVRGLLHNRCNTVLGFVDDDVEILNNLAKYLRKQ